MKKIIIRSIFKNQYSFIRIFILHWSIKLLYQQRMGALLTKARLRYTKFEEFYTRIILAYAINKSNLGQFAIAIKALNKLNINNIGINRLHTTAMLYDIGGEIEKRDACLVKVERLEYDARQSTQVEKLECKVFGSTFSPIGHTALIEIFVKAKILEIIPNDRFIISLEKNKFANFSLVEYWQKYCQLITEPSTVQKLRELLGPCEENLGKIRLSNGSTLKLEQLAMKVQLEWERSSRDSLLKLTPEHLERGWEYLYSRGLPKNSWFCGLHVRNTNSPLSDLRNAGIASYGLAIEEVSAHGGWVVRLGASGDERISCSSKANFIDYGFSSDKEDWLDIFILAEGRFLIGTGSGPSAIPISFGKPVLHTNWAPLLHRQWGSRDLLIPKQYWHQIEGRNLSMYERMENESIGRAQSKLALLSKGIEAHDNSPEIIRDAVKEMILDNQELYIECGRQKLFRDLCLQKQVYPTRLSAGFISQYPSFFERNYKAHKSIT